MVSATCARGTIIVCELPNWTVLTHFAMPAWMQSRGPVAAGGPKAPSFDPGQSSARSGLDDRNACQAVRFTAAAEAEIHDAVKRSAATRAVIEQAKGALMVVQGVSAQDAFAVLRWHSSQANRKLRDIAVFLTEGMCQPLTSQEPDSTDQPVHWQRSPRSSSRFGQSRHTPNVQ